jgi:ABC-type dipeptide/oligopeptide/nickel transport system permease subunit
MAEMATAQDLARGAEPRRTSAGFWSDALWRVRHDPTTIAALLVLAMLIALALSADLLADRFFHISFSKQDLLNTYRKPTLDDPAWWLGSDRLGRSEVVRLLYGARVSLFIGVFGAGRRRVPRNLGGFFQGMVG